MENFLTQKLLRLRTVILTLSYSDQLQNLTQILISKRRQLSWLQSLRTLHSSVSISINLACFGLLGRLDFFPFEKFSVEEIISQLCNFNHLFTALTSNEPFDSARNAPGMIFNWLSILSIHYHVKNLQFLNLLPNLRKVHAHGFELNPLVNLPQITDFSVCDQKITETNAMCVKRSFQSLQSFGFEVSEGFLSEFSNYRILLPETCASLKTYYELLEIFSEGENRIEKLFLTIHQNVQFHVDQICNFSRALTSFDLKFLNEWTIDELFRLLAELSRAIPTLR